MGQWQQATRKMLPPSRRLARHERTKPELCSGVEGLPSGPTPRSVPAPSSKPLEQVVHGVHGAVLEVNRTGPNRHLWHGAELDLPLGLGSIENPAFAAYPGGTWDNETFQRARVRWCSVATWCN